MLSKRANCDELVKTNIVGSMHVVEMGQQAMSADLSALVS